MNGIKKTISLIVLPILLGFFLKACTRDDICPEGAAITPKLIIVFKDSTTNKRKNVEQLQVETDYEKSSVVVSPTVTDSIAIPLRTTSDTTLYRFIKIKILGSDTIRNVDQVMFSYSRNDFYVTRACGFRTEFNNIDYKLKNEGLGNWIKKITIARDTISDEDKAHLTFFH